MKKTFCIFFKKFRLIFASFALIIFFILSEAQVAAQETAQPAQNSAVDNGQPADNLSSGAAASAEAAAADESAADAGEVKNTDEAAPDSENGADFATVEKSEKEENSEEEKAEAEEEKPKKLSVVPPAKRPKKPNTDKIKLAEEKDTDKDTAEDKRDSLKYGIESDIIDLLKKLSDNDDPRFVEEIYDLFQQTQSPRLKIAILNYFAKLEDPCLEDYAVTILNDPYDETQDLTYAVFKYTAAVKCKAAINAVMNLLENDNEKYFDNSLNTIGEIGGAKEAEKLAEYLDREDLSLPQRQTLMKVLGKIKAIKTWDKLKEIIENDDENTFVRAYAAEAIGSMEKPESIPILKELYRDSDPNLRSYAVKGLAYFSVSEVKDVMLEALRDSYYKVRLDAIEAVDKLELKDAIPVLIYRAKTDPEAAVKKACYPVLAKFNTSQTDEYLYSILSEKKSGENAKALVVEALMKYKNAMPKEVMTLAEETAKDDTRKQLRYAIGKQFVKYANLENGRAEFAGICKIYLESKDVSTQGMGLDLYAAGRYGSCSELVHALAEQKRPSVNKTKARRILKMPLEDEEVKK